MIFKSRALLRLDKEASRTRDIEKQVPHRAWRPVRNDKSRVAHPDFSLRKDRWLEVTT
jgi:hypothetical protein